MSVQADVDKHCFKKRTMGPHLQVRDGLGPTRLNFFNLVNTKSLEEGKKEDLKKYFDFPENMSAVDPKDGILKKIVICKICVIFLSKLLAADLSMRSAY